ncbi:MAG: 30S ribosomal protein S20 [Bryobacteraceae bacterium]|nr:30S ribosomal protein S20 [Bryobacteraceae bacterium]
MANHFSALKRARQIKRRTAVNRARRTRLRHHIRAFRRKLVAGDLAGAEQMLGPTFSIIDRAAKWGIIKPNTADRYKGRLNARLKKASAPAG